MIKKGSSWHTGLSPQNTPLSLERRTKLLFESLGKFPFARLCGPQSPWQGLGKLFILRDIKMRFLSEQILSLTSKALRDPQKG